MCLLEKFPQDHRLVLVIIEAGLIIGYGRLLSSNSGKIVGDID
jgi:hypothetical protein